MSPFNTLRSITTQHNEAHSSYPLKVEIGVTFYKPKIDHSYFANISLSSLSSSQKKKKITQFFTNIGMLFKGQLTSTV